MTPEQMEKLREPFPPEQVFQIPKPYEKNSPKEYCDLCKSRHGMPAAHLDYVGHADVTDRLIQVDPDWSWKPMGRTPDGLPALDGFGNLWIELTLCGVTRPGVGDGKSMKECVGDALRNAAMRFGVALDLWAKGDRSFGTAGHDAPDREQTVDNSRGPSLREQVMVAARPHFTDKALFEADFQQVTAQVFADADNEALRTYLRHLDPFPDGEQPALLPELDLRDKALAATTQAALARLLMVANNEGVKSAMVPLPDGEACTLETLIAARQAELREAKAS